MITLKNNDLTNGEFHSIQLRIKVATTLAIHNGIINNYFFPLMYNAH